MNRPMEVLLVEDNPGDVRLTREAFAMSRVPHRLHVVGDGAAAIAFLRRAGEYAARRRPDLVLLDLNLPRLNGREALAVIKGDDDLKSIPVIIFTSSDADTDIAHSYRLHANSYIVKPADFVGFLRTIASVEEFWLALASLPRRRPR